MKIRFPQPQGLLRDRFGGGDLKVLLGGYSINDRYAGEFVAAITPTGAYPLSPNYPSNRKARIAMASGFRVTPEPEKASETEAIVRSLIDVGIAEELP